MVEAELTKSIFFADAETDDKEPTDDADRGMVGWSVMNGIALEGWEPLSSLIYAQPRSNMPPHHHHHEHQHHHHHKTSPNHSSQAHRFMVMKMQENCPCAKNEESRPFAE